MTSNVLHLPRPRSREECAPREGGAEIISIRRPELVRPVLSSGLVVKWGSKPDNSGTVLSPGWLDLFGRDGLALAQINWLNLIHPDNRFRATMDWHRGHRLGESYQSANLAFVHGVYRPVNSIAFPVRDACGEIVWWEGYCQLLEEDKAVNF